MKKLNLKNYLSQLCFLLGLVIFFSACRNQADDVVHINKEDFNAEEQVQIGLHLKEAIYENPSHFKVLNKATYSQFYSYVTTLVETFTNTPNVKNRDIFNWDITIIEDDMSTAAFITPGGHIFIYTGLLKFLSAENQLSSIIAHEISYADHDYVIEQLKSEYGGEMLGDVLLGNDIPELLNMAFSLKDLDYTDEEILNSDSYSVELMCPFQYDATGIKSIIEKANATDANIHWLISKECDTEARVANITEMAATCGEEDPTFAERYEYYKAMLP